MPWSRVGEGRPWTRRRRRTRPAGRATAAGRVAPASDQLEQPEQRGRRVARRDDGAVEVGRATGRPPRPSGWCPRPSPRRRRCPGRARVHRMSLPAGRRARVMPSRPSSSRRGSARPASRAPRAAVTSVGRGRHERHEVDMPQAWIMRTDHRFEVGRDAGQVGLGPDGGERRVVDRGAVALVVEAPHGDAPAATNRPDGSATRWVTPAGRPQCFSQPERCRRAATSSACTSRSAAASVSARPCSHPREPTQADTRERGSPGRGDQREVGEGRLEGIDLGSVGRRRTPVTVRVSRRYGARSGPREPPPTPAWSRPGGRGTGPPPRCTDRWRRRDAVLRGSAPVGGRRRPTGPPRHPGRLRPGRRLPGGLRRASVDRAERGRDPLRPHALTTSSIRPPWSAHSWAAATAASTASCNIISTVESAI